jgi:transglutaminase-like putative cysteine protease
MFRLVNWLAVGFAVCMVTVLPAAAGIGFQPVSPDELKMTSEPLAPGAPAIFLFRQVDRYDNIYSPHEDRYVRIKILTEEGRKQADVQILFLWESADVVNVGARTIRPNGSIAEFDGRVYEKNLVKGRFGGQQVKYLAKTFTLPDVQVGSIIEYYYTIIFRAFRLWDSRWILSDELFTKKARFTLTPWFGGGLHAFTLRWSWDHLPPGTDGPKQDSTDDLIVRMEASNIPAFLEEDFMPPPDELKSRVDFIYDEGFSSKDQAMYWKDLGKKWNGAVESFTGKRKAMEHAVAQTVSPRDPPQIKLRKIYDRVQQIRNTSYEVLKTEKEIKREKEKPVDNVEEVWKKGYGDGVQLTWLFLAMARAAGFEAYGCLVSSRNEYFFTPVTMQGSKLNENVVLVKLNGKDVYFDPGGAFTPFGLLAWPETGVAGLRLDKDGGTWIQTTLPQPSESRIERVGTLKLSDIGDLEGKLRITYTGLEAMYRRVEERHEDDVARKKYLEERASSAIGETAQAELTNKPDWTSSEAPLVAEFTLKVPGWVSNAGSRGLIPAAIFTAAEKRTFEHANRVHPVYFEYPYEKADDITVELPPGWQVKSVPAAQDQGSKAVRYVLKVDATPGSLRLTRKVSINLTLLDAKYYPTLRDFFQLVRTGDGQQIVLQPGEIHANN